MNNNLDNEKDINYHKSLSSEERTHQNENNLVIKPDYSENHPLVDIEEVIYETWDGCCMVVLAWLTFYTILLPILCCKGLFTLEPNEAAIITMFGKYKGTVRTPGYHWINPWCDIQIISLRKKNFPVPILHVNDTRGNPIEIGIVLVWRIVNPIKSIFYVQNTYEYLKLQSEAAVRHLAASFPYDHSGNSKEITLLHSSDTVNLFLLNEMNDRLQKAGLHVDEARVIHLGYDKNVQNLMLKRQQAEALVGARQTLVEGVTGIVKGTIAELGASINLSDECKATLTSNLLVVLSGEGQAMPLLHLNNMRV